jgi:hypothetical protein
MKKVTFLITFIFVVSFLIFSGSLDARLPDLTIKKITVNRKCHLAVVVQNKGPGVLPDYVYTKHHPKSAGVYVYINGRRWGGQSIWKFDPQRNLQKPGGVATYISRYVVGATSIQVKAVVDLHNDVKEQIESNNALGHRALRCKPAFPTFPKPKKLWITISSIGQIHFWSSGGGTEELRIGGSGFGSSIGIKRVQVGPISLDASSVEEWLPDRIIMALPHVFPYAQTHNVYIKQNGVRISNIVSIFIKMDVTAVAPMAGSPGSTIEIGGIGFGATQGSLKVKFGTTEATVVSWADQRIHVVVPSIPPGSYPVYIEKNNTKVSTDKPFTI